MVMMMMMIIVIILTTTIPTIPRFKVWGSVVTIQNFVWPRRRSLPGAEDRIAEHLASGRALEEAKSSSKSGA